MPTQHRAYETFLYESSNVSVILVDGQMPLDNGDIETAFHQCACEDVRSDAICQQLRTRKTDIETASPQCEF